VNPHSQTLAGQPTVPHNHARYDAENRITQVDGGGTATYVYDARGRRVRKTVGGANTDFIYGLSGNVVAEWGPGCGSSCWTVGYVYANGSLLAEYQSGTTFFVHKDHLGSTRMLTRMDQSVYDPMDYLPFGQQTAGDTSTTHKFTGKERDAETGNDEFGARYYSSSLGRFTIGDWSAVPEAVPYADLGNPQTLNLYAYVKNNPLRYTDPSGHGGVFGGFHTRVGDTPTLHEPGADSNANNAYLFMLYAWVNSVAAEEAQSQPTNQQTQDQNNAAQNTHTIWGTQHDYKNSTVTFTKEVSTSQMNADGSMTITTTTSTATFSTKEGEGGKFLGGTTQTGTQTISAAGYFTPFVPGKGANLSDTGAMRAFGGAYSGMQAYAAASAAPGFVKVTARDARAHPWRTAVTVGEVGLLFVPVAQEYELYKAGAEVGVAGARLAWELTH